MVGVMSDQNNDKEATVEELEKAVAELEKAEEELKKELVAVQVGIVVGRKLLVAMGKKPPTTPSRLLGLLFVLTAVCCGYLLHLWMS